MRTYCYYLASGLSGLAAPSPCRCFAIRTSHDGCQGLDLLRVFCCCPFTASSKETVGVVIREENILRIDSFVWGGGSFWFFRFSNSSLDSLQRGSWKCVAFHPLPACNYSEQV
jgi:hypothetical protein